MREPGPKKSVTIRDVAREAGVAVGTVSRVISDSPSVSPETRRLVLEVIARLGYRPSEVARRLAMRRTETIGVLAPQFTRPYFMEVLRGVQAEACDADYSLIILDAERPDRVAAHLASLTNRQRVDGLIVIATDARLLAPALTPSLPFPVAGIDTVLEGAFNILPDHELGLYVSTRHLVGHGHRRVALIDLPPASSARESPRRSGYLRALAEANISVTSPYLEMESDSIEGGYASAQRLLLLPERPTAFACASDVQALGVLRALAEAGVTTGREAAVCGYNDVDIAEYACLTTVHVPAFEMGRAAVRRVFSMLAGDSSPGNLVLAPTLVVRASCGCAAESRFFGWPGFFPDSPQP